MVRITVASPGIYTYGAMLIGGILRDAGYAVTITREMQNVPGEVLFLSLYSTQHLLDPVIRTEIAAFKSRGGRCIIGGPVSSDPGMVFGELDPDIVVCGEGEEAVLSILASDTPDSWVNCMYREGENLRRTETRRPADLTRPLPLIPDDISSQDIRGAQTYIETHRGCFGSCGFCQVPLTFGRKIRSRTPEEIFAELKAFQKKGVRRIALIGGTGTLYRAGEHVLNEDAFIGLLRGMAEIMGAKNISCPDIRADAITDDILDAIRIYTIGWIFFGVESGSRHILSLMKKGIDPDVLAAAVDRCRQHNVRVAGSFIVGYPSETEEDFRDTKDLIERISPDDVFISIAEPIPGTSLAKLVLQTPEEENPLYMSHTGEYHALSMSVAEARAFDLMLHADICRPMPRFTTNELYQVYLKETRKQGAEIRAATALLKKYHG